MYRIDEREIEAIRRVFEKKRLFRYQLAGPGECDQFEREFAEKLGVGFSLMVTSGTNALAAALCACGIGPGDEVIIPSYTFVATATAVTLVGAIPIIANIDETLGISPAEIEARITDRTRAIIPVHMDGLAADLSPILAIARQHQLFVIEDVAQAIGGSYRGRYLGSLGDLGCFSLNENKNISCGEGGIVSTSRRDFYERVFCMQDASAQFSPALKDLFQETKPFMGASMRVSEISGAIMRVQLERLDGIVSDLRARKRVFSELLQGLPEVALITGNCAEGDCGSSVHLLLADQERAARAGHALRKAGILFAPPTTRPAHACWKWTHLLGERSAWTERRNPYRESDRKYSYAPAEYLQSVGILTRVLKMDIDIQASLDDTARSAERVRKVLSEC